MYDPFEPTFWCWNLSAKTPLCLLSVWFNLEDYEELVHAVAVQKAEIQTLKLELKISNVANNGTWQEIANVHAELERQSRAVVGISHPVS